MYIVYKEETHGGKTETKSYVIFLKIFSMMMLQHNTERMICMRLNNPDIKSCVRFKLGKQLKQGLK